MEEQARAKTKRKKEKEKDKESILGADAEFLFTKGGGNTKATTTCHYEDVFFLDRSCSALDS